MWLSRWRLRNRKSEVFYTNFNFFGVHSHSKTQAVTILYRKTMSWHCAHKPRYKILPRKTLGKEIRAFHVTAFDIMKGENRKRGSSPPCCPLFPVHQTVVLPVSIICLTWADLQPDNLHPWVSHCTGCAKSNGSLMQVIDKLKISEPVLHPAALP